MPSAKSTPFKKYFWPGIAALSLAGNAGLIGTYLYLVHYNQNPLIQYELEHRCVEPYYSRWIKEIGQTASENGLNVDNNKKFAAASLCFVDWETGRSVDPKSVKPGDPLQFLPPRP